MRPTAPRSSLGRIASKPSANSAQSVAPIDADSSMSGQNVESGELRSRTSTPAAATTHVAEDP
jgi:hypothetical protein